MTDLDNGFGNAAAAETESHAIGATGALSNYRAASKNRGRKSTLRKHTETRR